jgi:hypothetical protein
MLLHHISGEQVIDIFKKIFALRNEGFYKLIIAFLPTIIAISYPLIAQTISKVNETYNSSLIVEYFKKNKLYQNFRITLISSLIFSALTFFNNGIIDFIAFLTCVYLIFLFVKLIDLILKIYNPNELLHHILNESRIEYFSQKSIDKNQNKSDSDFKELIHKYYDLITDLYCYSIRIEDYTLQSDAKDKFYNKISYIGKKIESKKNEQLEFESIIFNNHFKIIETFVKDKGIETRYKPIEFFSTSYFLDYSLEEDGPNPINNEALKAIWRYLILLTKSKKFKHLERHWEILASYINLYLNRSYLKFDENSNITDSSERKNNLLIEYKNRLNEFNIAFLALLYYHKKYKLLNKILFHSDSLPPKIFINKLTPDHILNSYFEFKKDIFNNWNVSYYFDDLDFDSMGFQKDSKSYISEFCLILFLYCWIDDYGQGLRSNFDKLTIPQNLNSKKSLLGDISFIINRINKILNNESLISKTSLKFITRKNCFINDIQYPIDYLEEFKSKLSEDFESQILNEELDQQKIQDLKTETINQIKSAYNDISRIRGNNVSKQNRDRVSEYMQVIRGTRIPLKREAFLSNPTIHYIDYDKVLGRYIKNEYYDHLSYKLRSLCTKSFKVEFKEIFSAIDKLEINKDRYSIIAFNLNVEYLNSFLKLGLLKCSDGGEDYQYKGIPIFCFSGGRSRNGKLFVLRNIDKPMIIHKHWNEIEGASEEFKSRWRKMELIDEELKIFYEQTEIKDDPELLTHHKKNSEFTEDDINKMVQFDVDFIGYCWFPKDVKIICISQAEMFQQGGEIDMLDDIKPFDEI